VWYKVGPLRGGSSGASVRGPESQERARESLKCPMDLVIDVLFWFVHYFLGIFNSNPQFWEKFQSVLRPQSSILPPCNICFGSQTFKPAASVTAKMSFSVYWDVWKLVLVRLWRMTGYLLWDWCIFTEILKWNCTKQWRCSYLPNTKGRIWQF
jgi:hypothetical protein